MPPHRDVDAFNDRATGYDRGWRGRLHHTIADRTATLAVQTVPCADQGLDVGCGTGYLLHVLARHYPNATRLAGIDAAPNMVEVARSLAHDDRLSFTRGVAEQLDYPDHTFDLIVSTTSFDRPTSNKGSSSAPGCCGPAVAWCWSISSRGGGCRLWPAPAEAKPAPRAVSIGCCSERDSSPCNGIGCTR